MNKQEIIEINDELLAALNGELILAKLVREISTSETYKIAGPDLERQIMEVENQIKQVTARKQTLEEDK